VFVACAQHWQQQAGLQNTGMQAEHPQSAIGSGAKQAFGRVACGCKPAMYTLESAQDIFWM
jgi:hypothetical protein